MMKANQHRARTGFTLVEVLIAGVMTALILGAISGTLGQLSRAKATCKERLDAHLRADAALHTIRRDVVSVLRSDDLFDCRFLLIDNSVNTPFGDTPRDELLTFNTRLRPIRSTDFNGEGSEYETHYRVMEQGESPSLMQRADAFPDNNPRGGGFVTPLVEMVTMLQIEAYDGDRWYEEWDSDDFGIPYAVRITVEASGARPDQSAYEAVTATLRTVIAIDRVMPPSDLFRMTEEEVEESDARLLLGELDKAAAAEANAAAEAGGASEEGGGGEAQRAGRDNDSRDGGDDEEEDSGFETDAMRGGRSP